MHTFGKADWAENQSTVFNQQWSHFGDNCWSKINVDLFLSCQFCEKKKAYQAFGKILGKRCIKNLTDVFAITNNEISNAPINQLVVSISMASDHMASHQCGCYTLLQIFNLKMIKQPPIGVGISLLMNIIQSE